MNLTELKQVGAGGRRPSKRKGRGSGSGNGKTAGRGHKGLKARSGGKVPLAFEGGQMPLARRMPKRGFTNARFRKVFAFVNVRDLNGLEDGTHVTLELILERGLAPKKSKLLKVLGEGDLERKLTVEAHKFSASAREKIEKAGGEVKELPC
jgi:large subunit ribosomal protein L15